MSGWVVGWFLELPVGCHGTEHRVQRHPVGCCCHTECGWRSSGSVYTRAIIIRMCPMWISRIYCGIGTHYTSSYGEHIHCNVGQWEPFCQTSPVSLLVSKLQHNFWQNNKLLIANGGYVDGSQRFKWEEEERQVTLLIIWWWSVN